MSLHFYKTVFLIAGLFLIGGQSANATCGGGTKLTMQPQFTNVNVGTSNNVEQIIKITQSKKSDTCQFYIWITQAPSTRVLSITGAPTSITGPINFNADSSKSAGTTISTSYAIYGTFQSGVSSMDVKYYPWLDPNSYLTLPGGTYDGSFMFSMFKGRAPQLDDHNCDGHPDNGVALGCGTGLVATSTVNYSYTNPAYFDISIEQDGGAATWAKSQKIFFSPNPVQAGSTAKADVILKYNVGYKLTISSANGSAIKRGTSSIGYKLKVNNGAAAAIVNGVEIARSLTTSPSAYISGLAGTKLDLDFILDTLPSANLLTNGEHTDTITLSAVSMY